MNTYPTTAEQLFLEQKKRDDNNPECIEFRKSQALLHQQTPYLKKDEKAIEEKAEKFKKEQIAGFESKRYDFPEYHWWMIQDGTKYLRSSKNFNVYDYVKSSVIVGTWNEVSQRIEFCNDLNRKVKELEAKLTASNA
jgi:hypothetical protein